jgi:GNAT superfamily N-acetyltransferase
VSEDRERAFEFQRETHRLLADEVIALPEGRLVVTPSLPSLWAVNQLWIRQPVEFAEAVELADRHLADLPFHHLTIEDQHSGAVLEAQFTAAGWNVECDVTMVLRGDPDRRVDTLGVVDAPREDVLDLMRRWRLEGPPRDDTPDAERQLAELWQREWSARNARLLGARGRSGETVAITALYSDGSTAQVEDVYTVPEERGRGFARMLVSRAVKLSLEGGHEFTLIVGDDRNWPQQLYGRLGFEPVGRLWSFHRVAPRRPDQSPAR